MYLQKFIIANIHQIFIFFVVQSYEARIDALQRQVEEQSMTMSMFSSYTNEEFSQEEDIFGKKKQRSDNSYRNIATNLLTNCFKYL